MDLEYTYVTACLGVMLDLYPSPLDLRPFSDGFFNVQFCINIQKLENYRAFLVFFFKIYWTNFWLTLGQTSGAIISNILVHFACSAAGGDEVDRKARSYKKL